MYVLNPEHMGGFQPSRDLAVTKVKLSTGILSAAAYWNGHLYYYTSEDALKEFIVEHGRVSPTPAHQSVEKSPFSGGTPTVSARGETNGIVWIVEARAWSQGGTNAVLRAYNALDVRQRLYSSERNPARDGAGEALRFTTPTVANGRVYFGVKRAVEVYGLLPKTPK